MPGSFVVSDAEAPTQSDADATQSAGECLSTSQAVIHVAATGSSDSDTITIQCAPDEVCIAEDGIPSCTVPNAACRAGESRCDSGALLRCSATGTWESETCSVSCRDSVIGAFCAPAFGTVNYAGRVLYEARAANETRTAWQPDVFAAPLPHAVFAAFRGTSLVDVGTTNADGTFSATIPAELGSDDSIVVFALLANGAGDGPLLALGRPEVTDGVWDITNGFFASAIWSWEFSPAAVAPGTAVTITEQAGSGALRVFDNLRFAAGRAHTDFGAEPEPVVVWFKPETTWSCGTCFVPVASRSEGFGFSSQIFMSGGVGNRSYWSDAVALHEAGHWMMHSFGALPNEGGRHCLGSPTFPGQAWSEGWATAYSSLLRADPVYFDERDGAFLSFDISLRQYSTGAAWQRADPGEPLDQLLDENEVAAMLWALTRDPAVPAAMAFGALRHPAVAVAPFRRGYRAHYWNTVDCAPEVREEVGDATPMFADFLDALLCSGASPAAVESAVEPDTAYPYDASTARCD